MKSGRRLLSRSSGTNSVRSTFESWSEFDEGPLSEARASVDALASFRSRRPWRRSPLLSGSRGGIVDSSGVVLSLKNWMGKSKRRDRKPNEEEWEYWSTIFQESDRAYQGYWCTIVCDEDSQVH